MVAQHLKPFSVDVLSRSPYQPLSVKPALLIDAQCSAQQHREEAGQDAATM